MADLWATEDLPGVAWDDEPSDDTPDPDLWGQAITYWQMRTMTTIKLAGDLL